MKRKYYYYYKERLYPSALTHVHGVSFLALPENDEVLIYFSFSKIRREI